MPFRVKCNYSEAVLLIKGRKKVYLIASKSTPPSPE